MVLSGILWHASHSTPKSVSLQRQIEVYIYKTGFLYTKAKKIQSMGLPKYLTTTKGSWNQNNKYINVYKHSLSRVRLFATPWTVAYQAPPFMGFSRQECWSGLPFPSPRTWVITVWVMLSSQFALLFFPSVSLRERQTLRDTVPLTCQQKEALISESSPEGMLFLPLSLSCSLPGCLMDADSLPCAR